MKNKKVYQIISYALLIIIFIIIGVYSYHSLHYKKISFYFFNPINKKWVSEEHLCFFNPTNEKQKWILFFYDYEKGPKSYKLQNVFKHGNSVNAIFVRKESIIIDFYQNVIPRLNKEEEKRLIMGILKTLKMQKTHTKSPLYSSIKSIKQVYFTFGGYPFKTIHGAFDYTLPFSLEKDIK